MTPAQIETAARRKYNAAASSFFATAEIYDLIYQAELEIAVETKMLEGTDTSLTTTAGTQSYAYPTGVQEVKRVEVNGIKCKKIDFREDDALTLLNSNTTTQGTPIYYFDWNKTLYFRPLPSVSAQTIKIYHYKEPIYITSASQALEVPNQFHMCIVDRVVAEMASKDLQGEIAASYFDRWYKYHLPRMLSWTRKRRLGDSFNVVKDEQNLIGTFMGVF